MPGKMANGCCCAQRIVASVHSAARSRSPSSSQALMRLQYTLPVEYGPRRPSIAKSIASSRWPMPSATSPWSISTRPLVWSASASRSADRSARPRSITRVASVGGPLEVAGPVRGLGLAQQQRAVLGARRIGVERSSRPPQPPAGDGRSGHEVVVLVQPHRALPGPSLVADLLVGPVGELACRDAVLDAPQPPRGLGQHLGPFGLVRRRVERDRAGGIEGGLPIVSGQRGADRRQLTGPGPAHPRSAAGGRCTAENLAIRRGRRRATT